MSSHVAIIRPWDAGPLVSALARSRPVAPSPVEPLASECDRLRGAIASLERRRSEDAAAAAEAIEAATTTAYAAGLASAETRETERISVLMTGLAKQRAVLDARLDALDGLAAALARAALSRLFDRPDTMAAMVAATIARNIDLLRAHAAIEINVSGVDFETSSAIEGLCGEATSVRIDDTLSSGACRVVCRLGTIDLDVPVQWSRLAAALDDMAVES